MLIGESIHRIMQSSRLKKKKKAVNDSHVLDNLIGQKYPKAKVQILL